MREDIEEIVGNIMRNLKEKLDGFAHSLDTFVYESDRFEIMGFSNECDDKSRETACFIISGVFNGNIVYGKVSKNRNGGCPNFISSIDDFDYDQMSKLLTDGDFKTEAFNPQTFVSDLAGLNEAPTDKVAYTHTVVSAEEALKLKDRFEAEGSFEQKLLDRL